MEDLLIIIGSIWGILNIILFFKLWGMTNDVSAIKKLLETSKDRIDNKTKSKFNVGNRVMAKSYNGVMEIIDIYDDGSYNCIDVNSNEIVGVFKENELTKNK